LRNLSSDDGRIDVSLLNLLINFDCAGNNMMTILGMRVDSISYAEATSQLITWGRERMNVYICVANVHMTMKAYDSPIFRDIVNHADMVTPDGVPLVWMLRLKGLRKQERVYGPTLMLHVLESAAENKIPVGFYGGAPEVLDSLKNRMQARYPKLNIVYSFSPQFRDLNLDEDRIIVENINQSGVQILFVGLGCPKQEYWMARHRDMVKAVMLGVGAAFDFHAGTKRQAPSWMQKIGLEWLFRFAIEPRRLWRRYLYNNPRFVFLAIADLCGFLHSN
jgi:N-acetylglucosaminyldiphosphoundecaprenol N-acetyl-beta-D-mannosaminyltransferase